MTVSSQIQDVTYSTDDSTTLFPIPFYFIDDADIHVDKIDSNDGIVPLTRGTDFTVSGAGNEAGGTLTLLSVQPAGFKLHVFREVPITQETVYQQNDAFSAKTTEKALDKLTMICQQVAARYTNALRYPLGEYAMNGELPSSTNRAGKILGFDATGHHTMLPMPASVGAGDLKPEMWTAGVDFTAGTSTSVALSRAYGTKANLGVVVMAGVPQDPNTYDLGNNGTTLQFNAPIPGGVDRIWCFGGTTLSIYVPPDRSVGDTQINWGDSLGRVCSSVSEVAGLNPIVYTRAFSVGYYVPGDGGGGGYYYSSTTPQSQANAGTIIASTVGFGCWIYANFTGRINVKVFGAKYDGAADDTLPHRNGIAWLKAQGGGCLDLPTGTTCLSGKLTIDQSGVSIRGQGRGGPHDDGAQNEGPTIMRWVGAVSTYPMILVSPPSGATRALVNCSVDGVYLDGSGKANVGLSVWSVRNSVYRISGADFIANVFETHIFSGLQEASDVQQNDIWVTGYQKSAAGGMIAGFYNESVTSGVQGNFSFNRVWQISGDYCGANSGANAVEVEGADNNNFYVIQLYRVPGGLANGVRLVQSIGANAFACQDNIFWHCSPGAGGFYSAGTEAGSLPAIENNVIFYDKGNGPPDPVIGVGSSLWWGSNRAPLGQRVPMNGPYNQVIFADGRMRYSGTINVPAGGSAVITFPKPFSSVVTRANATPNGGSTGASWGISSSITQATISNGASGANVFWWEVEGN